VLSPKPIPPGPGQESVWDYPRPPALVTDHRLAEVGLGGVLVASSRRTIRILETSHPPTFAFPPEEVRLELLRPASGRSVCEWKGVASYWTVTVGDAVAEGAAWSYPHPTPGFESIAGHLCFYPARFECTVDGVEVVPQEGGFYGGWITPDVVGPFKGGAGSWGW
jgi:uncharacterized protein (DUF427 family)